MEKNKAPTILIVDDELPLRGALKDKLTHEGFLTFDAKNGEEGLAIALREHPDLILLDIVMPVMTGIDMLQALRKDEWGKSAEVIMLTNLSDNADLSKVIEEGTFDYFVKSDIKLEDVVLKIKQKLGR